MQPSFSRKPFNRPQTGPRMNERIRIPQIRLIGSDGAQLGIFATDGAIKMAREEGLDLVEIDPNSKPPVCKIMDYGKYKYTLQKRQHESKKKQVQVHVKEIKLRPSIDTHDLEFKINHVIRFLEGKDKAKVTVQFRGREMQHKELGRAILDKVVKATEKVGMIESPPKMEGTSLSMTLAPGTEGKKKQESHAKIENTFRRQEKNSGDQEQKVQNIQGGSSPLVGKQITG